MRNHIIDSTESWRLRKRNTSYLYDLACGTTTLLAVAIEYFRGDMAAAKRAIYNIEEYHDDELRWAMEGVA